MASDRIPVYTNLTDIFGHLGSALNHAVRWDDLAKEFEKRFGRKPAYIARAPGRINLIGEHIDYALFGVLPAAIERDILIACAPRPVPTPPTASELHHAPGSVIAENSHNKYARQLFAPALKRNEENDIKAEGWHLDINTKELRWESYVKAGYYGVLNHYFPAIGAAASDVNPSEKPVPVDLLVTGSVPAGSGLSSSAAMVVASTLAFLAVNGKLENDSETNNVGSVLSKRDLVKMAMENEQRVGVNSGGMDQAASVMSDPSSALYITFYPSLDVSPVRLPPHCVLVCANSLVVSDKAVTAKRGYNLRVTETLVGARVIARALGLQVGESEKITYRELVGRYAGEKIGEDMPVNGLMTGLRNILKELDVLKPRGPARGRDQLGVTMDEMIEMSGLSQDHFHKLYSQAEVESTYFQLYKRAKHVFSEALRVLEFRDLCIGAAESSRNPSDVATQLGILMDDSQTSCSGLFECSCPELDELTRLAKEAGAYGSRLTGAGWGGCTVSLVAEDQVEPFIEKLRNTYPPYRHLEGEALNDVIFATKPSSGACVYKLD